MYNHRSDQLSLLSDYPEPAATQMSTRGLRPARDGYKLKKREKTSLAHNCCFSLSHLDMKHTVFGRLVGGLETLQELESVHSDPKTDRPAEELTIENILIFVNPYDEVDQQLKKEREEAAEKQRAEEEEKRKEDLRNGRGKTKGKEEVKSQVFRGGVGKFIPQTQLATKRPAAGAFGAADDDATSSETKKKKKPTGGFGDFSSW